MKVQKSKFNYKLTNYIEPRIIKLYVIVLSTVLLIAILFIIGISIYRLGLVEKKMEKPQLYTEQEISSILKSPGLIDFIIPESLESGEIDFSLYREPVKMWTNEIVEHYIIAPEELGIDKISLESKNIIELKLDDIP